MHTHRIGVLTGGGDCPGLNAVLRGVTKAAEKLGWQVIGFLDGFEGLLPPARYIVLDHSKTTGIMQQGGTILGTSSRGHFVAKVGAGEKTQVPAEIIEKAATDHGGSGARQPYRGWWRWLVDNRPLAPRSRIFNHRCT
jgi:6-phosphofructokinase